MKLRLAMLTRALRVSLCALLSLSLSVLTAEAANHYIRDGGVASTSGTGACTTWETANACDVLPATLVRGDTYYIADGSYASRTFSTAASNTTLITIKKATVADHGTATGWDDTYGDGTAIFGPLDFTTPYWLLDGQVGGGPGSWKTGFGFKVSTTAATALLDIGVNTADQITVRHIELEGSSNSSGGGSSGQDGVALWGADGFTISYFYMHALGRCPFFMSPGNGFLAEYGYIGDYVSTEAAHAEAASIWAFGGSFPSATTTFRYNIFGHIEGTGGLMWDNSSNHSARLDVYGNVFWNDTSYAGYDNCCNGIIGGWTGGGGEDFYNAHVLNNTFVSTGTAPVLGTLPTRSGSNEATNNLFYSVANVGGGSDWATVSYNHFISTSTTGTNTSTGSGNPFTSTAGLDFTLVAANTAGTTLSSPYDTDPLGITRGADGTWDRGAYEFSAGADPSHMSPMRFMRGVPGLKYDGRRIGW